MSSSSLLLHFAHFSLLPSVQRCLNMRGCVLSWLLLRHFRLFTYPAEYFPFKYSRITKVFLPKTSFSCDLKIQVTNTKPRCLHISFSYRSSMVVDSGVFERPRLLRFYLEARNKTQRLATIKLLHRSLYVYQPEIHRFVACRRRLSFSAQVE